MTTTLKIEFKPKFIERYAKLTEFKTFQKYSLKPLRKSIRINTLKIPVKDIKERLKKDWLLTAIPWCNNAFFVEHKTGRRDIGNLKEHALGYIYIQEATSMLPPIILNPLPHDTVLDMCASPGSKSTQLAAMMKNKGILIANDYKYERLKPLSINLQRCGITNAIITLMHGQTIKGIKFDKILLDAPCSATGAIRKSLKTILIWNPNAVKRLANTQRKLINSAFNCLKENGTLVYSTCSLEPEENEGVVDYLLQNYDNAKLEEIKIKGLKRSLPIEKFEEKKYSPEVKKCLRIWPQDNDTCGFFVAKIRKM